MRELHAHETQAVSGGGKGWGKLTNPNNPTSAVAEAIADNPGVAAATAQAAMNANPGLPKGHMKKLQAIVDA